MSIVGERRSILAKPFAALLLLTIMFSLAVFLPKIMVHDLRNNFSIVGGGLAVDYVVMKNNTLLVNITNNYDEAVFIVNVSLCKTVHRVNVEIEPHKSHIFIFHLSTGRHICLLKIIYRIGSCQKSLYRVISY